MAHISATPFAAENSDNRASSGVATDALVERLFGAAIDTLEVASVHIGGRLGFYRSLADDGSATSAELAVRTGTDERYVREWLEQLDLLEVAEWLALTQFIHSGWPAGLLAARRPGHHTLLKTFVLQAFLPDGGTEARVERPLPRACAVIQPAQRADVLARR